MAVNSYKDDEQMEKEKSKTATLKRLFSYLLAYKGQILIVLLLLYVILFIYLHSDFSDYLTI